MFQMVTFMKLCKFCNEARKQLH